MKVKLALLFVLAFISIPGKEFASARLLQLKPAPSYATLKAINDDLLKQKSPCGIKEFPKDPCNNNAAWVDYHSGYYICDRDGRLGLYLLNCTLGYIPPAVFQIKKLEYLSVQYNNIKDLPADQLKSLKKLQVLDIGDNKFKSVLLPSLPSLEYTFMYYNPLKSLQFTGNLESLGQVNVDKMPLSPDKISCDKVTGKFTPIIFFDKCPSEFEPFQNCPTAFCCTSWENCPPV